jgi:hypothetical protein
MSINDRQGAGTPVVSEASACYDYWIELEDTMVFYRWLNKVFNKALKTAPPMFRTPGTGM